GAKGVKMPRGDINSIKEYPVPIPPETTEQQKIAHCLSSLDEVIGLQAKKVQALKQHKKGLMQQLFPAEGETTPRLRFPEFREAGAWEVKRLGEVCDVLDNLRKPVARTKRNPGPYPYYGASGAIDYIDQYIFDERLLLIGEDGAKWLPYEKTAFIVEGQYWVNNHAHVLRPTLAIDTLLENYLTALDISQHITGAAPPKLTLDNLRLIWVPLPPKRDEQQKIAHCLSSLDEVIGLESHKLDALKNLKKGLMQQLFPQEVA
ncbi:restriction endonuclease subunit S, partial [Thiolapillus sp.]|uniref:restriction endonuclease subunit S n=1 Tax=Thiolapillus sp. TaxID=2017437 RepID=UPI003AF699FD